MHVCLQIGDGSSKAKVELGLVVSGSNVKGVAFLTGDGSNLEFSLEGRISYLVWNSESVAHLSLTGSTFIQTGGTIQVEGILTEDLSKGIANWIYRPETGQPVGEKKALVNRIICSRD